MKRLPPGVNGPRSDGRFYGVLELGTGPDGRRRRRYVYGASPREAADRLAALRGQQLTTGLPTGPTTTLGAWLDHWLASIAGPSLRARTREQYAWVIGRVRPVIGSVPLAKLAPEHLEHLYGTLAASGLSPSSVWIVHRRLRTALRVAEERGRIARSPATLVRPPAVPYKEQAALDRAEVHKVLEAAAASPRGARWLFGLAMGARSGEVLGLTWDRLDLERSTVDLSRQLLRAGGAWSLEDVKSEKSRRVLPVPAELLQALKAHRAAQLEARLLLGSAWKGSTLGELVFPTATGTPMHRSVDRKDWLTVLEAAKVRKVRVHDARHTAATLMLEQGIDVKVVSAWLGHSSTQLTSNTYQHVTARLEQDAAVRIGAALWPVPVMARRTFSRGVTGSR